MKYRKCEICGMKTDRKDGQKRYFMARFPLDEVRCKKWVKVTGNEDLAYVPIEKLHDNKFICGKHFKDCDFKKKKTQLRKYAVPSIRLTAEPLADEILSDFPLHVYSATSSSNEQSTSTKETSSSLAKLDICISEHTVPLTNKSESYPKLYLESEIPPVEVFVEVETGTDIPCTSKATANNIKSINYNVPNVIETETDVSSTSKAQEIKIKSSDSTISNVVQTGTDVPIPSKAPKIKIKSIDTNVSMPLKAVKKKRLQITNRKISEIDLTPRKKKMIRKLDKYKLKLKCFKEKAKIFDRIQSKALKTMLLSAWKNQNRCAQAKRWSNNNKALAIAMYKKSPKLYRYFRQLVPMPSERTLQNILSKMPINTGINEIVLSHLRKKASEFSDKDKTCILAFDEMSLKKRLIYNHTNDNVEGYQDLGEHGRTGDIADKALVLLLQGVHKKFKQPLAHYFVKGTISSEKLTVIIKNAIKIVSEIGFNIIATVCDQGPTNVGALSLLKKFSNLPQDSNFFFVDNKKVYIVYDVPHLFKSIRNNFFEAGELIFDGMKAKWRHIIELHEKNKETLHFKKISALHVNPKFRAKMKVKLAAQILSNDVAAILTLLSETFKDEKDYDGCMKRDSVKQTANVIGQLDKLFDVTNGPASRKDVKRGIRENVSKNSIHHKLWSEFKLKIKTMGFLKSNSQLRLKNVRCVNGYYTTISSLQDIWKYVESIGFKYLNLRQLNQDSLENLFGLIRQHSPTNQNPTCHHFTAALKTTILNKLNTPIRGGNCEQDDNDLILDFHDLVFQNSDADEDINKVHSYTDSRDVRECYFDGPPFSEDDVPLLHLPDNETHIEERLFQTFKKQPTVYVSGYLASILIKDTSCYSCSDSLRVVNPEENKTYKFIALKEWWPDKLSLTYPTLELCKTVDICVAVFEREVRPNLHNIYIGKYCQLMMIQEVSTSWLCKEHQNEMMEKLLSRLSTLLIRNECRKQNVSISDAEQINADTNKKSQLMSVAK